MSNTVLRKFSASSMMLAAALFAAPLVLEAAPASAAMIYSTSQSTAIATALQAQIRAANGNDAAIKAAIASALQNAIASNPDAANQITATIIAAAEGAGASADQVGAGLAQGASAIASGTPLTCTLADGNEHLDRSCNATASAAVAHTLANQGNSQEVAAFQTTSTSLGHTELASVAGGDTSATGETGGLGGGGNNNGGNNFGFASNGAGNGGSGGGCLNPSCTAVH